ncbi:hypothetical protein OG205_29765 [Lentzea sp. NBC_00516]|uniref:hypothetical protein n=1 Tax=Lentzea sp. NBC_00516 TaxID=2903582 RepID=UPI002E7FFF7E|nr:hypothetical protein [Lentzea sp. NBC_00516]WUD22265.1 hypothetical protein OG205_29765 [Lentzea sp. NBC_00516]
MTEPLQRPKRPAVLIIALVLLPLASLFFALVEARVAAVQRVGGSEGLSTLILLFSLLAIWFNWSRVTSVVLLAFETVLWLPGAVVNIADEGWSQLASYVVIGAVFFVAGAVLVFRAPSNLYYRRIKRLRKIRRRTAID